MITFATVKKVGLGILIAGAVTGFGWHIYSRIQASTPPPAFSFSADKAPGWRGRENINVQAVARSTNYTGQEPIEKLPVADMTVFQGESEQAPSTTGCFLSYSYYNQPLGDASAAYEAYEGRKKPHGTLETFEPTKRSLNTFEGEKEFELRQYKYIIEGQDALEGYQIGFIPLSSGYIRAEGVCKTYEDLAGSLSVINSVELLER